MNALRTVNKFFPNVKRVVDARTATKIVVTPHDAASTAIKSHKECAMAVACKRAFHLDGVIISRTKAYLIKGKLARRYFVPISVAREVVAFDRGAKFMPGTYMLSPVPESFRLGVQQGSRSKRGGHSHNPRFRHITDNIRNVLGGPDSE